MRSTVGNRYISRLDQANTKAGIGSGWQSEKRVHSDIPSEVLKQLGRIDDTSDLGFRLSARIHDELGAIHANLRA
ncbi:hypothetical protein SAMN05443287_10546 [Micromonospora phaseoli]|uniref:Uncharacterized protein n=1 Tax=Micromonospora phaseoli TaxID=1144548 RepID=A0A1H6ZJG0_9ACTN|nr:hypothetical protein CLV64_106367 [Micromonospora phaseoli]SEJ51677.1 hypothetical protein SAMN05443287_10546 [Micromonospora phaseoli]